MNELKGKLNKEKMLQGNLSKSGSGSGTLDYNKTINKPKINGFEVVGDKTSKDYKLQDEMDIITEQDIDKIIFG